MIASMIEPPKDTPEYMHGAWASALYAAIGNPEILQAFRDETGNKWEPGKTGLDRMIDKACDAEEKFADAFGAWFNERVWGSMK